MKTNYMLLKGILTDGSYTTEDFLMMSCFDKYPTPTPTVTPTVTQSSTPAPTPGLTPTPSPTINIATPQPQIVLSQSNNWTYRYNDALIIRYVPTIVDNSLTLSVPTLPNILLPQPGQPSPIPSSSSVIRKQGVTTETKIGDLVFINSYIGQNIILAIGTNNYTSAINIGQVVF